MKNKKTIVYVSIVAILVLSFLFFNSRSNKEQIYTMYIKDDEIVYKDLSDNETIQITSDFIEYDDYDGWNLSSYLWNDITFSSNGKRVFYPEYTTHNKDNNYVLFGDLYYRDIDDLNKEPVMIDSNVVSYVIDSKGDYVVYTTYTTGDNDYSLYLSDLYSRIQIASDIRYFDVTDDLNEIGYLTKDGTYYIWHDNNEITEVSKGISRVEYVSDDLSTIYYIRGYSLYKWTSKNRENEMISSYVNDVIRIYDSGEVYYTKDTPKKEENREYLEYSLFYYNGNDSIKLADNITYSSFYSYDDLDIYYSVEEPVLAVISKEESNKVKAEIIIGSEKMDVGDYDFSEFEVSFDGKEVYFTTYTDDSLEDLYKIFIENKAIKDIELIEDKVSVWYFATNNFMLYEKDKDGIIYINSEKIEEPDLYKTTYWPSYYDNGVLTFLNFSNKTLKRFENGKMTMISNDVVDFDVIGDDKIIYLSNDGMLFLYDFDRRESIKIDEGVQYIIPFERLRLNSINYNGSSSRIAKQKHGYIDRYTIEYR